MHSGRCQMNVILVGYAGSGKSTIAKELEKNGFRIVEISDFVKKYYDMDGANDKTLLEYAHRMYLEGKFLKFVKEATRNLECEHGMVFVGPRRKAEITYIKEHFKIDLTIGVLCDDKIRYMRRKSQSKKNLNINFERRDKVERSWGMDEIFECCDYLLDNSMKPREETLEIISNLCGE